MGNGETDSDDWDPEADFPAGTVTDNDSTGTATQGYSQDDSGSVTEHGVCWTKKSTLLPHNARFCARENELCGCTGTAFYGSDRQVRQLGHTRENMACHEHASILILIWAVSFRFFPFLSVSSVSFRANATPDWLIYSTYSSA